MQRGHGRTPSHHFTKSWQGYGRSEIDWCGVRPYNASIHVEQNRCGAVGTPATAAGEDLAGAGADFVENLNR